MNENPDEHGCAQAELVPLLALGALAPGEMAEMEAHVLSCVRCQQEMEAIRPVTESLIFWPTDVTRPGAPLWDRLSRRIAQETGGPTLAPPPPEPEILWKDAGHGVFYKLLSTDEAHGRVSLLVRLAPGAAYPPHTHADIEELHLLQGELWINDRKLRAGDFNRADMGTSDYRVWSETGCTCVLITSYHDVIG